MPTRRSDERGELERAANTAVVNLNATPIMTVQQQAEFIRALAPVDMQADWDPYLVCEQLNVEPRTFVATMRTCPQFDREVRQAWSIVMDRIRWALVNQAIRLSTDTHPKSLAAGVAAFSKLMEGLHPLDVSESPSVGSIRGDRGNSEIEVTPDRTPLARSEAMAEELTSTFADNVEVHDDGWTPPEVDPARREDVDGEEPEAPGAEASWEQEAGGSPGDPGPGAGVPPAPSGGDQAGGPSGAGDPADAAGGHGVHGPSGQASLGEAAGRDGVAGRDTGESGSRYGFAPPRDPEADW